MISSPETTAAGFFNLICLLWLAEAHRMTFLVFSCSWAGGAVSNRRQWFHVLAFCGIFCQLWWSIVKSCNQSLSVFWPTAQRAAWTSAYSLFFFLSHSFVVDVWFEERWWMSAWFWGVQITFSWPIILTQEVVVWSIPVRTRWVWRN